MMTTPRLLAGALFIAVIAAFPTAPVRGQDDGNPIFRYDANLEPRWSSPEGRNGEKGMSGMENGGGKGHPSEPIAAGATCVLLDVKGEGQVSRIWLTVDDRSPEMLRSLKLEMFWDGEAKPAVSVPLGDFFCVGLGRMAPFQNALFADPEGRSFVCYIPMPFRCGARIQVTNESGKELTRIFFDVDFQRTRKWDPNNLYFHAYWSRDRATTLERDFELLPRVAGRGRFIGVNVGVNANQAYQDLWWGEGEVRMFLDGDAAHPTFSGTGSEDYVGTGWGEDVFSNTYSGCLVADKKRAQWSFYRLHIPDPVFFAADCRVTLQQLGGGPVSRVSVLRKAGVPLIPVCIDHEGHLVQLYNNGINPTQAEMAASPGDWENFYRSDDISATAYFYLNSPTSGLPALAPVADRIRDVN
ncbi:MAG TPA: glycoside hydrolase family 172 protein [Opitutaceae bacterium]|jgi:hypothetical protein|nr:glycoside hydrolase family 172 protein [Opitutaceae bacterium]